MKKFIVSSILLIILVLGLYYYISNIREQSSGSGQITTSKVQGAIIRNLDARYPPTPKEVVRFFVETYQILYNEDYSRREFEVLGEQLYRLYDQELAEENPWEQYLDELQTDVDGYRKQDRAVSSFVVSSATDVVYFNEKRNEENHDFARLHCIVTFRQGTDLFLVDHQFLLRKGEGGRWYILGWRKEELPS